MEDILLHKDEFILRAYDYLQWEEYILAKRVVEELLEKDPEHSEGHHLLGRIYAEQLNQFALAEQHFRMAIKYDSANYRAYASYLTLLKRFGYASEMLMLIRKAEAIPSHDKSMIALLKGEAFELLQDFENSLQYYKQAILCSCDGELIRTIEDSIERVNKKRELLTRRYFINTLIV